VIASITTLFIAAHDPDALVADDYYKQGLAINQTLDRERHAQALGLSGLLRVDTAAQRIVLTLEGRPDAQPHGDLVLRMIHPTRSNFDHTLRLSARPATAGPRHCNTAHRDAGISSWSRLRASGD